MSKMKKILAVLLTLIMTLAMTVTAFATTETNGTQVKVTGVEDERGVTVNAYQIIKYNSAGYYEPVIAGTISKDSDENLAPSADDVQKLAKRLGELGTPVALTKQTDGTYGSNALSAGTWMIIITGSKNYLYNPAIVSVQQGTAGLVYGELNLNTDSWGENVYLKKSQPTIKKEALTPYVQGVQYGDIIQFKITADIPSYTDNIDLQKYVITDTLTGLELVVDDKHDFVAKVGETDVPIANGTIVNSEESFTIDLASTDEGKAFVKANTGKQIEITYYAKVTTDAKITVDEANNTAKLEYSTNDGVQEKTDKTRHYTFGIDTAFSGNTSEKTNEFIKINDKGDVKFVDGEIKYDEGVTPLSGAEFQLHIGSKNGKLFTDADKKNTFTTDTDGRLEINGLDSDVTYYLVETKAPTGYTINSTAIPVKINAVFSQDGVLERYSVKIGDNETQYNYDANTKVTTVEGVQNPYGFKNTKLANLPSTGGIGTTIFTAAGCLIMIFAVAFLFASRRRFSK